MVRGFGGIIQTEEEITGRRTCPIAAPSPLKSDMDCLGTSPSSAPSSGRAGKI